jgi:hypothetical protein
VTQSDKLLERVLRGTSDASIPFAGLRHLLQELGFEERIRGSHHIFTKSGIEEILNLQPQGSHAKPYQVRQVRHVILRYKIGGEVNE